MVLILDLVIIAGKALITLYKVLGKSLKVVASILHYERKYLKVFSDLVLDVL